jgi:O-antigen/teichoic acid export membrane protein
MSLKKNILYNYLGTFWSAISGYLFLPIYLKFFEKEAFGLVMFATTIQSIVLLLDAGFSSAIKRKLAWRTDDCDQNFDSISFLRGIEWFYLLVLLCTVSITFLSTYIFEIDLFKFQSISKPKINLSINLMVILANLQLFISLYSGGLQALDKQVSANVLQFLLSLFRNGMVILIICFFPEPTLFFTWQLFVVLFFVYVFRTILFTELNSSKERVINYVKIKISDMILIFKSVLPFFLISMFSTINFQIDKILVSRLLPISEFGVYGMVFNLAQSTVIICGPIATAVAPRFVNLYSQGKINDISNLFRFLSKITTIISTTLGCVLFIYFDKILFLWTGNGEMATQSASFSLFMIIAGVVLSAQVIPYNLAVASLSLKPVIYTCLVNIILTIPLYYLMIRGYGLKGAGVVWVLSNIFMLLANVFFYMKKSIPQKYFSWLFIDFIGVGLIAVVIFTLLFILSSYLFGLDFSLTRTIFLTTITLVINFLIVFYRHIKDIPKSYFNIR